MLGNEVTPEAAASQWDSRTMCSEGSNGICDASPADRRANPEPRNPNFGAIVVRQMAFAEDTVVDEVLPEIKRRRRKK
jgi:hypothetical protein